MNYKRIKPETLKKIEIFFEILSLSKSGIIGIAFCGLIFWLGGISPTQISIIILLCLGFIVGILFKFMFKDFEEDSIMEGFLK